MQNLTKKTIYTHIWIFIVFIAIELVFKALNFSYADYGRYTSGYAYIAAFCLFVIFRYGLNYSLSIFFIITATRYFIREQSLTDALISGGFLTGFSFAVNKLINKYIDNKEDLLSRPNNLLKYFLIISGCSIIAATLHFLMDQIASPQKDFFELLKYHSVSLLAFFCGPLIVSPLFILWNQPSALISGFTMPISNKSTSKLPHMIYFILLFCICDLVFTNFFIKLNLYKNVLVFLPFVLLIWGNLKLNARYVTLSTFIITLFAQSATMTNRGPFIFSDTFTNIVVFGVYILAMCLSCFFILSYISEKYKLQHDIIWEKENFRISQNFANVGTWAWNIQTNALHWSERIAFLMGYHNTIPETTYENFINAVHPEDRAELEKAVQDCIELNKDYEFEHRVIWQDGSIHWLHEKGHVVRDKNGNAIEMLGVVTDITERKSYQEKLERQLEERNVLLQEVHHRVKNNLQTIISLLGLQSLNETDIKVIDSIDSIKSRLFAMAMVHKQLHEENKNISATHVGQFFNDLSVNISQLFDFNPNKIAINTSNANSYLDLDKAISCGLIVNELLTNSLKHAFDDAKEAQIDISVIPQGSQVKILYLDNGKGRSLKAFPKTQGLGTKIIQLLGAQLDPNYKYNIENGSYFEMNIQAKNIHPC